MARTKIDASLKSRSAREKLPLRREPYWLVLEKGRALGYRKGLNGGTWIARYYDPVANPPRVYESLGAADDVSDPDGKMVLSFAQAQEAARRWFKDAFHQATGERVQTGDYTVADVVRDYLADRERNGAKTAKRMKWDFEARVLPALGEVPAAKLTRKRIEDWLVQLAASPARRRGVEGKAPETEEEIRARKESANRLWKNFRAALNLALKNGKIPSDAGWRDVHAFRGTTRARIRFLSVEEQQRLVNAAPCEDFRRLLQAGLFTGARESELIRLVARDFDGDHGTLFIEKSKTGKSRHIALTEEARAFFVGCTAGLDKEAPIFPRVSYDRKDSKSKGTWSRSELCRMMAEVCRDAKISPMVFHELRHTYASGLVNSGVALVYVAAQLGHSSTKMVLDHYGHLCPDAKAEAIRKLSPVLGIAEPAKVTALKIG